MFAGAQSEVNFSHQHKTSQIPQPFKTNLSSLQDSTLEEPRAGHVSRASESGDTKCQRGQRQREEEEEGNRREPRSQNVPEWNHELQDGAGSLGKDTPGPPRLPRYL